MCVSILHQWHTTAFESNRTIRCRHIEKQPQRLRQGEQKKMPCDWLVDWLAGWLCVVVECEKHTLTHTHTPTLHAYTKTKKSSLHNESHKNYCVKMHTPNSFNFVHLLCTANDGFVHCSHVKLMCHHKH